MVEIGAVEECAGEIDMTYVCITQVRARQIASRERQRRLPSLPVHAFVLLDIRELRIVDQIFSMDVQGIDWRDFGTCVGGKV